MIRSTSLFLKAVIAILIARWLLDITNITLEANNVAYVVGNLIAALGAILGHNFPIYYGFKGGKGIATSLGALLMIEWQIGLVCLIFALSLMILSRMVLLPRLTDKL